jgi:site-specific recombinase XerD
MIEDIFPGATFAARLIAGPLGSHLNILATVLQKQGYSTSTISTHLREAHAFGCWLSEKHLINEIGESTIDLYLADLSSHEESYSPQRRQRITSVIRLLLKHLRQAGVISPPPVVNSPQTEAEHWLIRYQEYLENVSGLSPRTCQRYLFFATRLLAEISPQGVIGWSAFTADKIIDFLQAQVALRKGHGPHPPATALRSFLRFLVSQGQLLPGLELAIPPIRQWSQSALPQRLNETEINHLLASCADQTVTGRRNYAMILLLSRLGLRAKEVTILKLNDIDWINGSLLVRSSKTHSERLLPLPQDVGEALLSYIRNGRPQTADREIFLTVLPPYRPMKTSAVVSVTVKRLIARAGISRQRSGAHLLRHSAASQMVNSGASFKEVADILGHQQLQTTGVYAKLNLASLSEVALPWPGGEQ